MSASLSHHPDVEPALRLKVVDEGPVTVLALIGDLDLDTVADLDAAVCRLVAREPLRLVLDCAHVTFCGAAGITALINAQTAARRISAELVLLDPSPSLDRVLKATGCWERFPVRHGSG